MAGRGPAPSSQRRRKNEPARGDWQATPGEGWQHGPIPDAPDGIRARTAEVWNAWMRSWFASHWLPEDLPGLAIAVRLYELVEDYAREPHIEKETRNGDTIYVLRPNPASELRQMMDNYGITPKGQQDRRWSRGGVEETVADSRKPAPAAPVADSPYGHLRVAK